METTRGIAAMALLTRAWFMACAVAAEDGDSRSRREKVEILEEYSIYLWKVLHLPPGDAEDVDLQPSKLAMTIYSFHQP